eukprot:UN10982
MASFGDDVVEFKTIQVNKSLCCGCCDIFVGVLFISGWNLFMSLPFLMFGSIGAYGFKMADDFDKTTYQTLFGLLLIPGVIRVVAGGIGIWLSPKLRVLLYYDEPNKRPDDYNEYEILINIWNWVILWTPIVTHPLLVTGVMVYIADVSTADTVAWKYDQPSGLAIIVTWLSFSAFLLPIIDCSLSFYFYTIFKGFVERRFKNY